MYKQVIIVRTDLGMGKGKMCSQAAHASVIATLISMNIDQNIFYGWLAAGYKKAVLKTNSEELLMQIYRDARDLMPAAIIVDQGLTQIKPNSKTAVAIGPYNSDEIDKMTGHLKLL